MGTWSVWQRLLWKECREGWPVLAICAAPPLARFVPLLYNSIALISILITLWAVNRVYVQRSGHVLARNVLPVPAFTRVVMTYLAPLLLPLIAGAVIGFSLNTPAAIPSSVLFMLSNFALSTVLVPVLTAIPAILAGVTWMFFAFDPEVASQNNPLYFGALIGALLAAIAWETSARHQRYVLGRIGAVAAMVGAVAGSLVIAGAIHPLNSTSMQSNDFRYQSISLPTGILFQNAEAYGKVRPSNISFDLIEPPPPASKSTTVSVKDIQLYEHFVYQNRRMDTQRWVAFQSPVLALGYLSETCVLFAQQPGHEKEVRLISWDFIAKQKKEYLRIPLRAPLQHTNDIQAKISPDGRHAILLLKSRLGLGSDLWLVDLSRKQAALVWPNYTGNALDINRYEGVYIADAAWTADRVILSINGSPVAINLKSWRAETMPLPLPGGTAQ